MIDINLGFKIEIKIRYINFYINDELLDSYRYNYEVLDNFKLVAYIHELEYMTIILNSNDIKFELELIKTRNSINIKPLYHIFISREDITKLINIYKV